MKLTLKQVNDRYLLETGSYSGVTLEIDGKRVKDVKNGWLDKKPASIKTIEMKSRVTGYGGLTPDEYKRQREALINETDDDGDPLFSSLEAEYAYKKFIQDHPANYEQYEDIQDAEIIEYNITGRMDNPFVVPFRYIGGKEVNEAGAPLYQYQPQPYLMAQDIAKELGLEEVPDVRFGSPDTKGMKWSVSDHSKNDLEYTKINGNYADYKRLPKFYGINSGTWEECENRYNEHYSAIRAMFEYELKKLRAEGKQFDKAKIIEELETISRLVGGIDAKRGSSTQPHSVRNRIREFIEKL